MSLLDSKDLELILANDELRERSLIVMSIIGAKRQGDNFMINWFLSYLESSCETKKSFQSWLSNPDEKLNLWNGGSNDNITTKPLQAKTIAEIFEYLVNKEPIDAGNKQGAKFNINHKQLNQTPLDLVVDHHLVQMLTKSINIPRDDSCLLWAVTLAYLTPVKNNNTLFNKRCEKLFGLEKLQHFSEVLHLIQNYNPFIKKEKSFNNKILKELVTNQFRTKVVNYMSSNLFDSKDTITERDGELEIKAMSKILGCLINVYSSSTYFYNGGSDLIVLYHESLTYTHNHYNFGVDFHIVDEYRRVFSEPDSTDQQAILSKIKSADSEVKKVNSENRKRFHDKDDYSAFQDGIIPAKFPKSFLGKSNEYQASGLKHTLHGTIYQLKLLMLFIRIGVKNNYQFQIATEIDAAEKFDDLVFRCQNDSSRKKYRFLQAKHRQDESQNITANELLSKKDLDFSLQKYFISFRRIKTNPEFAGDLHDFVLCTNTNLDFASLNAAQINKEEIIEKDFFFPEVETKGKLAARYKLNLGEQHKVYEILRETSDIYVLANTLIEHIKDNKQLNLKNTILKSYHTALVKEEIIVIEENPKKKKCNIGKFNEKFINYDFKNPYDSNNDPGLSESAKKLREILQKHLEKNKPLSINKFTELKVSNSFGKRFDLIPDPQITDIELFSKEIVKLVKAAKNNLISIDRSIFRKNAKDLSLKAVADNIDKLAGHVLIMKDDQIEFRKSFLLGDITKLPGNLQGNLKEFKNSLETNLQKEGFQLNDLGQYQLKIGRDFNTCEEGQLFSKNALTNNKIEDKEISEFLEKLVFAVNQPNEIDLSDIIKDEMGKDSQFNLLNANLVTNSFEIQILDWFKGKEGTWISHENSQQFFNSIEAEVNTLVTVGLGSTYPEELKSYKIEFRNENQVLKDFLCLNDSTTQIFKIIASTATLLSAIKVYRTLANLSKTYKRQDSYIFIRLTTILLPKIQKMVIQAFSSPISHDLLVIDCDSYVKEQDIQILYTELYNLIHNPNKSKKKLILITMEDDALANKFLSDSQHDTTSFVDLTLTSQDMFLQKQVIFQGVNITLNKLVDQSDRSTTQIIDLETLLKSFNCTDEVTIGNTLKDLGEIYDYYISRGMFTQVTFNRAKIDKDNKSSILKDFFVVSGSYSGLANNNKVYLFDNIKLAENQYKELCAQNIESNIHWLKSELGKLIYYQSKGSIFNLVAYREIHEVHKTDNKIVLTEKQYLEENKSKIQIISNTAGMGKSTLSTSLSLQIKKNNPDLWVIKIDLNDYTKVLNQEIKNRKSKNPSFINDDVSSAVNFLINILLESQEQSKLPTKFEKDLFKSYFNGQGKIALFFDGFDEISPNYQDVVIDVLLALKISKAEKIFVTTRPNMREMLEKNLEVFSHELEPFDELDQIDFLTKFWTKKLKLKNLHQEQKERLNTYAKSLISTFSKSIKDIGQKFISIPLQTMMLAKIFQERKEEKPEEWDGCKEFLASEITHKTPKLPEKFDLLGLYDHFIKKKFYEFNLEEKKHRDFTKSGEKKYAKENFENFKNRHHIMALSVLLSDEDLNKLISTSYIEQLNDWIKDIKNFETNEGIIDKIIDDKPHFIHRTFAEYFFADFLANTLLKNEQSENIQEFLLREILLQSDYQVIRSFLNSMLVRNPLSENSLKIYGAKLNELWENDLKPCDEYNTILHIAADENNHGIVTFILDSLRGYNNTFQDLINTLNYNGRTALHSAAFSDNLETVKCLVEKGFDVNVKDTDERTVLFLAVSNGNLELIQWLVKSKDQYGGGADVNAKTKNDETPLYYAAERDNLDIVKVLIQHGSDVNAKNIDDNTVLHNAIHSKISLEIVRLLVENDASVSVTDENGNSVLHYAAYNGKFDVSKFLVEKRVDVNAKANDESTVLHEAVISGNQELCEWLITEHKLDVNAKDENNRTPLHEAAEKDNLDIVKLLIRHGSLVNAQTTEGNTVLLEAAKYGSPELCEWLITAHGLHLNDKNNDDYTMLHLAAKYGNLELVEWLLDQNVFNPGVKDKCRNNVLTAVCKFIKPLKSGSVISFNDVVWKKVSLEKNAYMRSDLYSTQDTDIAIIKCLIKKGADVNAQDEIGKTILHYSVESDQQDIVKWLISTEKDGGGANITLKDGNQKTAFDLAMDSNNSEIIDLLLVRRFCSLFKSDLVKMYILKKLNIRIH